MKAKVLKKFKDKYSGKIYKPGTVIEVTEERFEEIRNADKSLIEAVEEKAEEAAEEKAEEKKPARKTKAK
jgi:hypothetical protein